MSADLSQVRGQEVGGPEDSMCLQPGLPAASLGGLVLGGHDMTQPIVTCCHMWSCQVLHVQHEHTLDKDSEEVSSLTGQRMYNL